MERTMEKELLTIQEVADRFSVSRRTVYRLINDGKLSTIKISPKHVRISTLEVESYIKKNTFN